MNNHITLREFRASRKLSGDLSQSMNKDFPKEIKADLEGEIGYTYCGGEFYVLFNIDTLTYRAQLGNDVILEYTNLQAIERDFYYQARNWGYL